MSDALTNPHPLKRPDFCDELGQRYIGVFAVCTTRMEHYRDSILSGIGQIQVLLNFQISKGFYTLTFLRKHESQAIRVRRRGLFWSRGPWTIVKKE